MKTVRVTMLTTAWLFLALFAPAAAQTPAPGGLPAVIPIFPLEDATLFPNASVPLHIFEPRYRAMIADALKGDRIIGMVTLRPGHEADSDGRPPIFPVGCAGLITQVEQLPDGRYNIVLGGLVKFRITSEDHTKPYRLATVLPIPEPLDDKKSVALMKQRERLVELLEALAKRFDIGQVPPGEPDEQLVDELAQSLPTQPGDRQRLLELEDPVARATVILALLEELLKTGPVN